MRNSTADIKTLGIVGAGAMGQGIAQIASLAGIEVLLSDANNDAIEGSIKNLKTIFNKLVNKGKITEDQSSQALRKIITVNSISKFKNADMVIEAIIEDLPAKQSLLSNLEDIVEDTCILASNTSSLSITKLASGCRNPYRILGCHFFNPVPLMKVAEIVQGTMTSNVHMDAVARFVKKIGHTPVFSKDSPGFIVNHAGRAMNTEGLQILSEGVASCSQIDDIMRDQAGFRLGPFELMDLTSLDVSHPVMESIYHQFYEEPRFRPSPIAAMRLSGGLLGKKTGEGFYKYIDGDKIAPERDITSYELPHQVWISKLYPETAKSIQYFLSSIQVAIDEGTSPAEDSLILVTPFGKDIATTVMEENLDPNRTVGIDALFPIHSIIRRTVMFSPGTGAKARCWAQSLFAVDTATVETINDSLGFVSQRIIAMIVNTSCEIAQQRIASPTDIDNAVELGLGYPRGPLKLGDAIGPKLILEILNNIFGISGDPRYRPSSWLRRRAQLNLSLLQPENSSH